MTLSRHAALILDHARRTPGLRSRDLRHALPETLTRRQFSQAWRELGDLGLLTSLGEVSRCPVG